MAPEGEEKVYDAAIIGGGLGGLALAILLRAKGRSVLVLEAGEYPRHKVCGEYVSNESRPFLERLGLRIADALPPEITTLEVSDLKGRVVRTPLGLGGFGISRWWLDAALARRAEEVGATLLTRSKADAVEKISSGGFRIRAGAQWYSARAAAGAWGKRSGLDARLKRSFIAEEARHLAGFVGIKHHVRVAHPAEVISLHNFPGGYCGVSAVEESRVCLCYLVAAGALKASGGDIPAMEGRLLYQNPHLARLLGEGVPLYDAPLAISQVSFAQKEPVADGVLMLGDAAGLITPLCGNGMSIALRSAALCAPILEAFLSGRITYPDAEHTYAAAWRRHFAQRLGTGRALQSMFGKRRLTSAALTLFRTLPPLRRPLIRATHGAPF